MTAVSNDHNVSSDAVVEGLLRGREAQGLAWAARARLVYILLGVVLAPFTSPTFAELAFTESVLAIGTALSLWIVREARLSRRLTRAGVVGIGFDVLAFSVLPLSWYHSMPAGTPPVFLVKADINNIVLVLAAVNTFTLRPLYPLAVTGVGVLHRLACLWWASGDPRTRITWDATVNHLQGGVHPTFFMWDVLSIAIMGVLLALLTAWARRTVRAAIQAEAQNWQLRERQAQLIADAKITGMGNLVAGVAHELNSPLGTVRSSFDSLRRGASRLVDQASSGPGGPPAERLSAAIHAASRAGEEGLDRITSLMRSLRDFSRLDEAHAQVVDLRAGLDAAIELAPPHLRASAELTRDYGPLPPIRCRPAELNQVFFTVLTNALEAVEADGSGRVTLRTYQDGELAVVEVEDNGCGIARERLADLFEVGFATKDRRVGLRVGLPIARRVVHEHGGSIQVKSAPGRGTVMSIRLPI